MSSKVQVEISVDGIRDQAEAMALSKNQWERRVGFMVLSNLTHQDDNAEGVLDSLIDLEERFRGEGAHTWAHQIRSLLFEVIANEVALTNRR